jgi:hypothetical protein
MIFDEARFTPRRQQVLVASRRPGRVWRHRGDDYLLTARSTIETVTSVTAWLEEAGLLKVGKRRNLGGFMLVPTNEGLDRIDAMIHGAQSPLR